MSARRSARTVDPIPDELPPCRSVAVSAADGTRLHAEVFGPSDGYPIVLTHGITCTIRAWAHQIADLANDYRVIAFDHRGHGRSGVPRNRNWRQNYSLKHLASDLDSVLDATLAPHERAVVAGHSMGGITIAAWSARYQHKVRRRADAVALINTTTGDLVRKVKLLPVPHGLSPARVLAARGLINAFGGFPVPSAARIPSRRLVAMLAVGRDAEPGVARLVYEFFEQTSPAGRAGCARMLVAALGSRHLDLDGLTVPTLVIGGERDRLTPISQSRRIARTAPNVVGLVELPGGHCSMLEEPREVNHQLRALAESVNRDMRSRRISS
jgi:pimeloyl-ACP methyl ester carboxylesterase